MNGFQVIGFVVVAIVGLIAIAVYTGFVEIHIWQDGDETELKKERTLWKFIALAVGLGFVLGWTACWLIMVGK